MAVGDSFTEGLDDPAPGGGYRGWADLVAAQLAARDPAFRYANLAVRGRLLAGIVAEQVPVAERLRADVVSIAGGGNDVIRPRYDAAQVLGLLDDAVGRLAATGATVVVFTGADITARMPGTSRLRPRIVGINTGIRAIARHHGAALVDVGADAELTDPRFWSEDRLHLSTAGHLRVAALTLDALGVPVVPEWREPLPFAPPAPWVRARAGDLRWARRHLTPWVQRRLAGRSSGDGLAAKRPELAPFDAL